MLAKIIAGTFIGTTLASVVGLAASVFWTPSPQLPNRQAYQVPAIYYVDIRVRHDKVRHEIAGTITVRNTNPEYSGGGTLSLLVSDGRGQFRVSQPATFNGVSDVEFMFGGSVAGNQNAPLRRGEWSAVGTFTEMRNGWPMTHNVRDFRRSTEYDVSKYGGRF